MNSSPAQYIVSHMCTPVCTLMYTHVLYAKISMIIRKCVLITLFCLRIEALILNLPPLLFPKNKWYNYFNRRILLKSYSKFWKRLVKSLPYEWWWCRLSLVWLVYTRYITDIIIAYAFINQSLFLFTWSRKLTGSSLKYSDPSDNRLWDIRYFLTG